MGRLVNKVGLYAHQMKEFNYKEKNSKTTASVKGKMEKVLDAQVLLRGVFLKDLLTSLTTSLVTQKQYLHKIETVESVEKTKPNYKRLLKQV